MKKEKFDLENCLSDTFKNALRAKKDSERALYGQFTENLLNLAYHRHKPHNENTFGNLIYEIGRTLTQAEHTFITELCLDASTDYIAWRTKQDNSATPIDIVPKRATSMKTSYRGAAGLHGGAGYTGRLFVGTAAPFGSESFQSDDDPREGRKDWVKALTGAGAGSGYSLGEIAGARQRAEYGAVLSSEELRALSKDQLLGVMDKATNPGNFLRAMLTYYRHTMVINLGNFSINSGNINNHENRITASRLDSVYGFMKKIDDQNVMTPVRALRFLVLCNEVLSSVMIKYPRRDDNKTEDIYNARSRELRAARLEIKSELDETATKAGISPKDMRGQIESDKKENIKKIEAAMSKSQRPRYNP